VSRPLVGPRLRRVLAYLPWIADHPGVSLDEIAERFDVRASDLERDLELLPFVGLPPYTPDRLIDVAIVDDCVWVRFADAFASPLRFTADEGLSLLAAGNALLEVPGSDPEGPLARAIDKLASALDAPAAIHVDVAAPDALATLRDAAAAHRAVEIDYYSYHRNASSTRVIEPWSVASLLGHWYVRAHCRNADAERLFRVDRIQTARALDETFIVPETASAIPTQIYEPSADTLRVTLDVEPNAAWVLDTYPIEDRTDLGDGRTRIIMAVSTNEFLARLLLRLGRDAALVAPTGARNDVEAIRTRILARYGASDPVDARGTMASS